MKRIFTSAILLALMIGLFMVPQIGSNNTHTDQIPQEDIDPLVETYYPSAEGDPSGEDITEFRETTDDDVLFFPDAFLNDTSILASSGTAGTDVDNTYTATHEASGYVYSAGTTPGTGWVQLNFTLPSGIDPEGFFWSMRCYAQYGEDSALFYLYNWDTDAWVYKSDAPIGGPDTITGSEYDPDFWEDNKAAMRVTATDADAQGRISVDLTFLNIYQMHLADSDHYAESFSSVSDWTTFGNEGADTLTTDGDVAVFDVNWGGGSDYDQWYVSGLTFTGSYYIEIRYKMNRTGINMYLRGHEGSDPNGAYVWAETLLATTTWKTLKVHKTGAFAVLIFRSLLTFANLQLEVDYLRIGPADEMGWQHDGSTTTGASNDADAGFTYTTSSDGDVLSCNVTRTSGSGSNFVELRLLFDTTTTAIDLERDYYQFWEARVKASRNSAASTTMYVDLFSDGFQSQYATTISALSSWTTLRRNHKASTVVNGDEYFRIGGYLDAVDDWINFEVDWCKAFSIANFSSFGSNSVSDYAYVDNSVLVFERSTANSLTAYYESSLLSVSTAPYNVWNVSTDATDSDNFQFAPYTDSAWYTYDADDTRGDLSLSGSTCTRFRFFYSGDMQISAIKFWEDSVTPTITNTWATPYSPTEADDVTLSVYTSDWTDLYSVTLNAIDSPATFNDVDYECSKNSEDSDLWTYTFDDADVPAGYYAFQATANDGANTITDLVIFRVVAVVLQITDIVLITATEDLAQISGYINKGSSYNIYENDSSVGSGSVAMGWLSISWTKDATAGTYIELGIKFNSSVYTEWVNGSYSVASAEVLSIINTVYTGNDASNTLSGESNLGCDYYVYENDTQVDTGSLGAGSFSLNWNRNTTDGLISWGAKFTDGTTTRWVNGTYYNTPTTYDDLMITSLGFSAGTEEIAAFIQSNWNNCTIHLYDNDTIKASGNEGSLSYVNPLTPGLHQVGCYVNGSAQALWVNFTYSVASEATLSITALTFDSSGSNITVFVNTIWGNCTVTVYEDDVQKTTGSEGTQSYLKTTTAGNYDVGVKIDGTADLIWANFTYTIGAVDLDVDIEDWGVEDVVVEIVGISNLDINWYIYNEGIYSAETGSETGDLGFQFTFAKNTAFGKHNFSVFFNTTDGSQYRWFNRSYTISSVYATSNIYTYDQGGDYIAWEQFTFLINGTQIYGNEFYNRTDHVYLITIQDVFGSNLYSATHSWARTFRITLDVYTFIVANMLDDQFIYFNMTRTGGATWSKHIVPNGHIEFELLYAATYNYEYTTVATDGTVRTATGTVTVECDTAVIIFSLGLTKILSEIRLISPGGGVGKEYVEKAFATVNATLGVMWAFLWAIGGFLVLALWIVPFVSKRRRSGGSSYSPSPSQKPRPPGSEMIIPSASKAATKGRKQFGIPERDEKLQYGPRE